MKAISRLMLIVLMLVGFVLPAAAQEEAEADSNGVITVPIDEGSAFSMDEAGNVLLTIRSELGYAPATWFLPEEFGVYNYPFMELQADWDFAGEELSADAVLTMTESFYNVTISAPTFDVDAGTLTYVVSFENELETDKDGNLLLPQVSQGTLFIEMNKDFIVALGDARDERLSSTRATYTCANCNSSNVP